nr:hypothetical protein BaRGS_005889 [Batillaria attramentaria]
MPHYHCVAIGCQNGSRKSDKLEKFPETVLPNGGLFASPALESTRLFVTGNSGLEVTGREDKVQVDGPRLLVRSIKRHDEGLHFSCRAADGLDMCAGPIVGIVIGVLVLVVVVCVIVYIFVIKRRKENFNVVIFSESTNSRGTKLGMLID